MEGGVEKFVSFPYLVYVIIGLAIGPAIEYLFKYVDIVLSYQETLDSLTATKKNLTTIIPLLQEQYDIVLSYQETLDSLTATKENLTTIIPLLQEQYPSDDIERQGSSAESAVKKWAVKLQNLHGDGSAKEPNIARINVVSRYRETNKMKQKISEMEKHLKLFPLIQLELILMCHPARIVPEHREHSPAGIVREVVTGVLKRAAKSILPRMKMVIHFNREVASLKDLVTSITPIIDEISEIPRLDVYPAINGWCEKMRELDEKAEKIESLPGWNVIRRYKDPQDVASLISTIEAHVKSASLVSLEPLFQELQQEKRQQSESLFFQKMIDLESQQRKLRPSDSFDKKPSGRPQKLRPSVKSASVISLEPLLPEMMDLESTSQQKKLRPSAWMEGFAGLEVLGERLGKTLVQTLVLERGEAHFPSGT